MEAGSPGTSLVGCQSLQDAKEEVCVQAALVRLIQDDDCIR